MSSIPLLVLLVSLLPMPLGVTCQSRAAGEVATLLRVRRDWGDPWVLRSWNSSSVSSPCRWTGVECSSNGTISRIILSDMNITGKIPPALCDLEDLVELDLAWNYIPGEFPMFLYNCSKLQVLDLSQNVFVGQIPNDIDRLPSSLSYLDLGGNNFTGDVPAAIGRISSLQTLKLYQNEFDGTFPKEIGDLSNLEFLWLAYNGKFTPQAIPQEFGRLKNLKFLWMKNCNLIGQIPESFNNLSSLEHLDLSINAVTGGIPDGLFMLQNLSYVYLFNNQLSGKIPSSVMSMNLTEIDLSSNNLTGPVPVDIGKLDRLTVLNLFRNQLSGEIPVGIGRIPSLTIFHVFSNNFNGMLPPDFGLNSLLEEFEVSENQFTGPLPENLCAKGVLLGVVAFSNNLSGGIPKSLSACNSLHTIQIYRNNFSGEFPEDIWALSNLSSLMIGWNSFSGSIPSKLAENLSRVDISNNGFSGELPVDFSSWSAVKVFLASNNMISGKIPTGLTGLSNLMTLSLDVNRISGKLPSVIGSWQSLISLNLSRNNLSDQIPTAIGSLSHLLDLDLSNNRFSGSIPPQLSNLKFTILNLSSNQLSGKVPTAFENAAYEMSFLNNSDLCSESRMVNVHSCDEPKGRSQKMSPFKYLAIVMSLAVVVGVFAVLFMIVVYRAYQRKKLDRDFETWKIKSFEKVDFTEANILYKLTDDNLIGRGGSGKVYRVLINGAEEHIAVKRISRGSGGYPDPKQEREFLAEVEMLGTMRHRNIVKLLCYISSENSKLLVYEYMENQSLDRWLHGLKPKGALDWPKRLQIAIGAAQGLSYMHHDCSPPVIHRDIKSSNILLDFEFKAKVADFGLAKIIQSAHGDANGVSTVAGSFGYFAPELAYTTKLNEKIDMYSFGVVLLELVTGREAHNGDEDTSLANWAWRHYVEGRQISDAMDETIRKVCYLDEMTTVFKLGLACTSQSPASRPSMKEVLHVLQQCTPREGCGGASTLGTEFDVIPLLGSTTYLSSYKPKTQFPGKGNDSFAYSYSV
ncbi:hypothetical protein MLD38_006169 [Melastoma candidum]|uniref:Uncharacterized protein n=1 Tax=Melastoma candidum TaxID=119954 RepID=A0ACB9RLR6_9MYRT|nr:hypothetical protein MLD38_006169 [Melastoma candidum]